MVARVAAREAEGGESGSAGGAEDFIGTWRVSVNESDSIEPMLKAMGVGWKIRKIVIMLKVLQHIDVQGREMVVRNVSEHGEDTTTHVINGGKKVIRTSRRDEIVDECTFKADREFPLRIVAELPQGKGTTIDNRKLSADKSFFVQHLTYKHPEAVGKKDIIMKRIFVRADGDDASEEIDHDAISSLPPTRPLIVTSRQSSARMPSARRKSTEPGIFTGRSASFSIKSSRTSSALRSRAKVGTRRHSSKISRDTEPNHMEMWVVAVFCVVGLTVLYFSKPAPLSSQDFLGHLSLLLLFFVSRIAARMENVTLLFRDEFRWIFVVLAFASFTFTVNRLEFSNERSVGLVGSYFAGAAFIVMRVHAGIELPEFLGDILTKVDDKIKFGLSTLTLLGAGTSCFLIGADSWQTALLSTVGGFSAFALWYEKFVGAEAGKKLGRRRSQRRKKGIKDKDGNTLHVQVVDFRVVDDLYAQYKVKVTHEGLTWYVWRRFSQFDTLRHELRRLFGHGVLPQIPAKTWFASLDEEFLNDRKNELDQFMQDLLSDNLRKQVFKIAEMRKFLGVGQGRGKTEEELAKLKAKSSENLKATEEETDEMIKRLKEAKKMFEDAISVGEGNGWTFLKSYQGVECYLKIQGDFTFTKGVGTVKSEPLVTAAFMSNPVNRKEYDDLFKKDTVLRVLDAKTVGEALGEPVDLCDVKYVEFKSPFPMVISARDTVLLSCRVIHADGTVAVYMTSGPDELHPPKSQCVRAKVFAAGVKLQSHPDIGGACIMSNVQAMDPNGAIPSWVIKAVAPERCAMSAKVDEALQRLRNKPEPLQIPK